MEEDAPLYCSIPWFASPGWLDKCKPLSCKRLSRTRHSQGEAEGERERSAFHCRVEGKKQESKHLVACIAEVGVGL